MSHGIPSQPRIFTPSTFRALVAAKGEVPPSFRGWKWVIVLVLAIGTLLFILVGPFFMR